jgi:ABC-type polysaccharide/polyol phosphate export permease
VIAFNPLTYGVALVRRVFYLGPNAPEMPGPGFGPALLVTLLFGAVMFALAVRLAHQETRR